MKYYESHEEAYRKIKKNNMSSWGEFCKESEPFKNFSMKEYLISALDKIKPISNAKVLEIGCGTGPISCFLSQQGYDVYGFDVSQTAIEIARKNAKERSLDIHYSIDDICSISKTKSDIYDIIIDGNCMHCITYDSDRHAALTNVFRLLKDGGYEDYPYDKVKFEDKYWICTRRIMNPCDLENELKQIGFLINQIEIHKDEKVEYLADFRAICIKPMP
jgi:2-polyprenyl-3-methyl-5-hydroxy-6-metoxy-1,4-benzoquinol methylase